MQAFGRHDMVRRFGIIALASGVLLSTEPVAAQYAPPPVQHYDIPAQELAIALARFAQVSHVDIIYDDTLATNVLSMPIEGDFTPQQVLVLMLKGTGLAARFTRPNAALILPRKADPGREEPGMVHGPAALVLDTLTVEASPRVGLPRSGRFDAYGRHVLGLIDHTLRPEAMTDGRTYRATIRLWIDLDGKVRQADFTPDSGSVEAKRHILDLVRQVRFDAPPPDMPQPLRVQVEAR